MDRQILNDPVLDAEFKKQGYILPTYTFTDETLALKEELSKHTAHVDKRFYSSTDAADPQYRRTINEAIRRYYKQISDRLPLLNYSYYYGTLIIKESGNESEVIMHTDWSITDEERHPPVTIWIPLMDTNPGNGCFSVVKGTHKLTHPHRGVHVDEYYTAYYPELQEKCLTYLPMKTGQPLIYHNGLIHYSPPNLSGETRLAVLIALYPAESRTVFYFSHTWSKYFGIAEYQLDEDFFNYYDKWHRPAKLKFSRLVSNKNKGIPLASFLNTEL